MIALLTLTLLATPAHAQECRSLWQRMVSVVSPNAYTVGPVVDSSEDFLYRVVEVESLVAYRYVELNRLFNGTPLTKRVRKLYGVAVQRDQNSITLYTPRREYETIDLPERPFEYVSPSAKWAKAEFLVRPATAAQRLIDAGRVWRGDTKDLSGINGHHVVIETTEGARLAEGLVVEVTGYTVHLHNVRDPSRIKVIALEASTRVIDVSAGAAPREARPQPRVRN